MTRNVLITGGLGYVGGRVSQHLSLDQELFPLVGTRSADDLKPGWLERGRIVNFDMLRDETLDLACRDADTVIHFAALNEIDSASNPEQATIVNGIGTFKLLKAALRAGVKQFIYFSTAHIYRAPLVGVITEETLPKPVHPYAITHKVAEDFVLSELYKGDMKTVVLRLSNGFGAPTHHNVNRWTLVVNDLCRQAVENKKLVLKSSGLQYRDFITLHDVCRAVSHIMALQASQLDNGIFNLGGENSLRIIDVAELVVRRCNAVLGFVPPIERPEPKVGEKSELIDFKIDKLKATGFALRSNVNEEIDNTLLLCQKAFCKG